VEIDTDDEAMLEALTLAGEEVIRAISARFPQKNVTPAKYVSICSTLKQRKRVETRAITRGYLPI